MPGPREILFPVDFSQRCELTAPAVAQWTTRFQSRLTLLHAIALPPQPGAAYSERLHKALQEELREHAREAMLGLIGRHFEGIEVQSIVQEGDPASLIVDHARRSRAGLIMMPTHGYGTFRRFLIGSVTGKVLHDSVCSVWTDAHASTRRSARSSEVRRVLCAVNRNSAAASLASRAARLARLWSAELQLVHVIPASEDSENRGEVQVRRYWTSRARQEFRGLLGDAALANAMLLRGGSIGDAVADTAKREKADLLVIGRGRLQKQLGRLRTHSLELIAKSPCPVISV